MDSWHLWPRTELLLIISTLIACSVSSQAQYESLQSSYSQRDLSLKPYEWTYLRVELPLWFSSVTMSFLSNTNIGQKEMQGLSNSEMPILCLKDGNPIIPDLSDAYLNSLLMSFRINGSVFEGVNNSSHLEQCVPFQSNLTVVLTKEQISPGGWYIGYFNRLGPERTQSKMISRGKSYKVTTNIYIFGCSVPTSLGPGCNRTMYALSCMQSFTNGSLQAGSTSIICSNSNESPCLNQGESSRLYYIDITTIPSQFNISLETRSSSGGSLIAYVRYDVVPVGDAYDYSLTIGGSPLTVDFPRVGRWYIIVQASNFTGLNSTICFSLEWQVISCGNGKTGIDCSWDALALERIPKRNPSIPFGSYYLPKDGPTDSTTFPLVNLLSNYTDNQESYTFFFLDIPAGAAGSIIRIQIRSIGQDNFELYSKFGGLPSNDTWDYYATSKNNSGNPVLLSSNGTTVAGTGGSLEMYMLYAREGTWCIALRHPSVKVIKSRPLMSVSLVGCYKGCNGNGTCKYSVDESGLTFYSYCACDRDHGAFDCSDELVSPKGHVRQSIFLIGSNAAAILPAYWAIRQKAFAEWILYTSSGISSALYHACDVGTWCILSFRVLQFLDFWLSFMAVVSTFIYMATIDESSKRAIHAGVFILTAILAATGATRTSNIGIVIAIGSLGLLIGWLLEFNQARRLVNWSQTINFQFHLLNRWEDVRSMLLDLLEAFKKRFRWEFLVLGFVFLAFAGTSWKLESNRVYWIWHSLWHITIYTSSFFFLCSTRANRGDYELSPDHDSSTRGTGDT
ncbi:transmembrane protein [Carex littledalei]|uniref:Transmembrane protein n=1 Tax=Carex littledalei TaxID=544730 RepID=A0A833V866_9POAL|nr:transmembrane protein [Carex littledalei]